MSTIGQRIKHIRKSKNLTQEEFSKQLRLSRPYISCIEHGKDNPSSMLILLISIVFDVSEDWVKNGSNE